MKAILRSFVFNILAIWLTSLLFTGVKFSTLFTLLLASLVFGLFNIFLRPVLKLVMLPINFLTLGLFSWVINVGLLYLTTIIVPGFIISAFAFPGLSWQGMTIPPIYFSTFWAAVAASFSIGLITNVFSWIIS